MSRLLELVAGWKGYAVVAVALGWLFYREPFGFREAMAMLVIFSGVAIVKWTTAGGSRRTANRP